jgi:hypothetical protein
MVKKILLTVGALLILVLCFATGMIMDKRINSADLSLSLFTHAQCVNQKCVVVNGTGQNQCSIDDNCLTANDPQHWCDTHNTGVNLKVVAQRYPDGNFSCDCYYLNKDGTHSQASCTNSHLQ